MCVCVPLCASLRDSTRSEILYVCGVCVPLCASLRDSTRSEIYLLEGQCTLEVSKCPFFWGFEPLN